MPHCGSIDVHLEGRQLPRRGLQWPCTGKGPQVLKFIVLQLCEQIDALSTWNACVCGSNVRRNSAARREVGSSGSLTLSGCEEP